MYNFYYATVFSTRRTGTPGGNAEELEFRGGELEQRLRATWESENELRNNVEKVFPDGQTPTARHERALLLRRGDCLIL